MGDRDTTAEKGIIFDVVYQEGGGVEHADDFCDDLEAGGGDLEPSVEGGDELFADILTWVIHHVIEGP